MIARSGFPVRSPATPPKEPEYLDPFWKPQPGGICMMQGDGTKGWVKNVKIIDVDEVKKTALVKPPGDQIAFKVKCDRLKQWLAGERKLAEVRQANRERPSPEQYKSTPSRRVGTENVVVINKATGNALTSARKTDSDGYQWVKDPNHATVYATRKSAQVAVCYARKNGDFDYTLIPHEQAVRIYSETLKYGTPEPEVLTVAEELSCDIDAAIGSAEMNGNPRGAEAIREVIKASLVPSAIPLNKPAHVNSPKIQECIAALEAATVEENLARELYVQARAKRQAARGMLRLAEATCGCMVPG